MLSVVDLDDFNEYNYLRCAMKVILLIAGIGFIIFMYVLVYALIRIGDVADRIFHKEEY